MTNGNDAYATFSAARLVAAKRAPYFRSILYALIPREAPGLGTVGVSERGVLTWDPAFAAKCDPEELGGVLVHECMHVVLKHGARCRSQQKDPNKFNIAGDLSINPAVRDMGCKLPQELDIAGIFPENYGLESGKTAEEYYELLEKGTPKKPPGQQPGQNPGASRGWCGSCAGHGQPGEEEGDAEAGGGRTEAQMDRARRDVAEAVKSHASKGTGNVPGELLRWADKILAPPRVPWQKRLAKTVRDCVAYRAGAVDFKYTRPSRRQAGVGYGRGCPMLPGLVQPVPKVAVAVDTSGSMGTAELNDAMREVNGVLKAVGADVEFCSCDCEIGASGKIRSWRDATKLLRGGGGTSFLPIFDLFTKRKHRPSILIIATDGMGPAPESPPPGMTVIWLLIGPYQQRPAPWGTCIALDSKEMKVEEEEEAA